MTDSPSSRGAGLHSPPLCLHNRNVNFTLGTSVLMKSVTLATDAKKGTVPRRSLAHKYDYETRVRYFATRRRVEHERQQIANFSAFCNLYFTARGGLKFLSYMHGLLLPRGGFSSICRRVQSVRSLLINSQLCVRANAGCKQQCNASV